MNQEQEIKAACEELEALTAKLKEVNAKLDQAIADPENRRALLHEANQTLDDWMRQ